MTKFMNTTLMSSVALAATLLAAPHMALAAEDTRDLSGFTAVHAGGSTDVEVTVGEAFSVVVSGDEDVLEYITTEVRGGALHIGREDSRRRHNNHGRVRVLVSMPSVDALASSGSGDLWATGVATDGELDLDLRGSGDMGVSGTATTCDIDTRGSGDLEAEDLTCGNTSIKSKGSGDVELTVNGEVSISSNGSGDIDLSGDARIVELRSRGSGDISIEN